VRKQPQDWVLPLNRHSLLVDFVLPPQEQEHSHKIYFGPERYSFSTVNLPKVFPTKPPQGIDFLFKDILIYYSIIIYTIP
jgi:hypothetical protein